MLSMRKLIAIGAAIVGAAMFAPASANAQQLTAYATNDLNLREGPGTRYNVLLTMPQWSQVTVNSCSNSESWCYVQYGNYTGWASSLYLTTEPPRTAQIPQNNAPTYNPPPQQYNPPPQQYNPPPQQYNPPPQQQYNPPPQQYQPPPPPPPQYYPAPYPYPWAPHPAYRFGMGGIWFR